MLKTDSEDPSILEGFAGIEGKPVRFSTKNRQEVVNVPRGEGIYQTGSGMMTGRVGDSYTGYPVPGYGNPIPGRIGYNLGFFGRGRRFRRWGFNPYLNFG